jgi:hypothetical protein
MQQNEIGDTREQIIMASEADKADESLAEYRNATPREREQVYTANAWSRLSTLHEHEEDDEDAIDRLSGIYSLL